MRLMTLMRLRRESNGSSRTRGSLRFSSSGSSPALRQETSRQASVGSPYTCQRPLAEGAWASRTSWSGSDSCRCALEQSAPPVTSSRSTASSAAWRAAPSTVISPFGAYPVPLTRYSWVRVHRYSTVISLRVSVPVLSVQITDVEPRDSTLESFLTSALRLLMRCTAMASARVTVGSRPSGMKATTMPREKMKVSASGLCTNSTSRTKNATPMHRAKMVICRVRWLSSRCSGLTLSSTFWVRRAILPNLVVMPV